MKDKKLIVVREHFRFHPKHVLNFLCRKYPDKHIVYWLRNTLFAEHYNTGITPENIGEFLALQKKLNFRIVSFDKGDCEKYDLMYVPQSIDYPGFEDKKLLSTEYSNRWDVVWVGKDKDRDIALLDLKKFFDENHISYNLQLLGEEDKNYDPSLQDIIIHKNVPYRQYLSYVMQSKAVLDLCQKGQKGLTNRALEAMHLHKKLITDYLDVDSYDFYQKENVLILGKDDLKQLNTFLNTPYRKVPDEIIDQYTTEGMIRYIYQKMDWDLLELE